jgi:CubicO group peptidase (beta-lactamase class C family)
MFSTAADLERFTRMWLDGGIYAGRRLLRAETVALATRDQHPFLSLSEPDPPVRCGLGWMLERSDFMGHAPARTYGHTGFTGPVLVVVPAHRLLLVLLCNRTYPRRAERTHLPVVAAVLDALLAADC